MNNNRRKAINRLIEQLEEIQSSIEDIKDEEEEYYNSMPESLQDGEKGDRAQSAIDNLDDATNSIGEVLDSLAAAAE
jgi:hypothetical protein